MSARLDFNLVATANRSPQPISPQRHRPSPSVTARHRPTPPVTVRHRPEPAMSAIGSSIGRLIAVTSCKGGVGKSTVSLELARRLQARGHRVGVFDADVHGPSLPTQLPLANEQRVQTDRSGYSVLPLEHDGLKLMSFGWFSQLWNVHKDDEIRIGRPMLCVQLLQTTAWGELDYLVVDSPPGTGEVLTALATRVPLTGALVVTTPSKLAAADVVRGVRMLRRHDVPVVALVENMASFSCGGCGAVHHPFGRGHLEALRQELPDGLPCFSLPIVPDGDGDGHGDGTAAADANSVDAGGESPTPLSVAMEEVAACVERATAHTAPVRLHALRHHESTLPYHLPPRPPSPSPSPSPPAPPRPGAAAARAASPRVAALAHRDEHRRD